MKVLNESNRILQEKEEWFKEVLTVEEEKYKKQSARVTKIRF